MLVLKVFITPFTPGHYPVRLCTAGLHVCVWSHRFVYVCMCVYVAKNCLFELLPLENLSLV